MSCPKKEVELILGCRNGVTVYKREKFLSDGTYDAASDEYSDGLGALGRTPGECPTSVLQKDPEIVCMTNDGGETIVKGVVIFSYDGITRTSTVNNLDGSLATGYTVIPCATSNRVEEGEVRCDGGVNIVPFYDVETDGVASATVAFWFNPITNAVVIPSGSQIPGACAVTKIAQVPNCSGGLDSKSVDSITATYLLNQENKHTEVISDVLTAVFGGTVAFTYTAPTNVAISYAGVTLANDTIVSYRTDFGDGYNDVGPSPSHSYNADGSYEIKGYAITLSGNKVLLYAKEVNIASGVISYAPAANPQTVARTYKVLVAKAFQDYCGALPVGTAYNADGSAYSIIGDFEIATPIIIDELEDNADYQASVAIVCKKEIFATHIKWIATPGVPVGSVAYELSSTLASVYGGTNDATNTYIHMAHPALNGTFLIPTGPQLTEYFSNPQSGVLFTDVATIQAMTDNALLQMGLSVGDAVYAVNTNNEPIWFLSPTAVAELANSTFIQIYFGANDAHNGYDGKSDITVVASNGSISLGGGNGVCTPIQEIKEKDSCTGEETYRYVIENLSGLLVPVTDIYPAFVEADVMHEPCIVAVNEVAGGVLVTTGNTFTIPADTVSFTVSAQTGSFDVSFDGGTTYALTGREGTRTRGQGTIETISNSSDIVVLSNGDIDIIRETI